MSFTAYENTNRMMALPVDEGCLCNKALLTAAISRGMIRGT